MDQPTLARCSAWFPDIKHMIIIESNAPNPGDSAMSASQRLDMLKRMLKPLDAALFGNIGCTRVSMADMGRNVEDVTCFLGNAPHLALTLRSDQPAQRSYEAVRSFLEKAAARRK
jgi:hypothetical protein